MDQNLSNFDLKLLTDSADTTLSGKLFQTDSLNRAKGDQFRSPI